VAGDEVLVRVGAAPAARFRVVETATLDVSEARSATARTENRDQLLIAYQRSSPDARRELREAGLSYVGADGRVLLQASPLFVDLDRPADRPTGAAVNWSATGGTSATRNPFATKSSRVARWLLLNPTSSLTISDLAAATRLSLAATSRAVQALDDQAVVEVAQADDARRREVRLRRPRALLDAWLPVWQRRRLRRTSWDVGAGDVDEAIRLVADAANEQGVRWALGGLAGAATIARAVEPDEATVWIGAGDLDRLAEPLMPQPARGGRGLVRLLASPDAWTIDLAKRRDGMPVADPVQLWLDCSSAGERSLEAAAAVAKAQGW
jgi:hypothetical protein